jgi:hypothetical protein
VEKPKIAKSEREKRSSRSRVHYVFDLKGSVHREYIPHNTRPSLTCAVTFWDASEKMFDEKHWTFAQPELPWSSRQGSGPHVPENIFHHHQITATRHSGVIWLQFHFCLWVLKKNSCRLVVSVPGYRYRGPVLGSRRYQIFWEVVGLERSPRSLVRIIEELLEWKSSGSGLENRH